MQVLASLHEGVGEESPFAQSQARRRERGLPETQLDSVTTLIEVGGFPAGATPRTAGASHANRGARRRISDWESAANFVQRHGTGRLQLRRMRDGPAHARAIGWRHA